MTGRVGKAETGSRPAGQAPSGLDASRFDPARKKDLHALRESGWMDLRDADDKLRPKFLFGGPIEIALRFSNAGILDADGFTALGQSLRDIHGRGKAALRDRREA